MSGSDSVCDDGTISVGRGVWVVYSGVVASASRYVAFTGTGNAN